jgi:hypothetical protein
MGAIKGMINAIGIQISVILIVLIVMEILG